ncbi:T9SS type A sorting domain-containing protein [Chryseobacterium flavum]|uniref:T9SS type A sorting domain-containing protein n=1 Tax=Chryseobacterium flavum TaxID=415851 RepID=UPI002FDB3CB1
MKKIILITVFSMLLSSYSKAQIVLEKEDGSPIINGIITYNTTTEIPANLHYKIKNTSSSPINVRIKVMDIINATGSNFQFCYLTTCLPFISKNSIYPANSKPAINIPANSEVSSGYTMWNSDTGTGAFPIDYVFKYYLVDDFNNEYGIPVIFTYRYDPGAILQVDDTQKNEKTFVQISSTVIKNSIDVISIEDLSYSLYNLDGRILSGGTLKKGKDQIDVSVLNSGMYIITFRNNIGKTISKKIIKN